MPSSLDLRRVIGRVASCDQPHRLGLVLEPVAASHRDVLSGVCTGRELDSV